MTKQLKRALAQKVPAKVTAVIMSVLLIIPSGAIYAFANSSTTGEANDSAGTPQVATEASDASGTAADDSAAENNEATVDTAEEQTVPEPSVTTSSTETESTATASSTSTATASTSTSTASMPAVTLTQTLSDGTIVTVVAPEGALPEGVTLVASIADNQSAIDAVSNTVAAEGYELKDAKAIDVTLLDKDGNEVEPSATVAVTFSNTNVSDGDIGIYHVSDNAAEVEAVTTSKATTETQTFDTNHFSTYVITSMSASAEDATVSAASTADYTVEVGSTTTISGTSGYSSSWTSSNSSIASVSGNRSSATVTGVATGTATITHTFSNKPYSETFTVQVTPKTYAITFNENGGSISAPSSETGLLIGQEVTMPDYSGTVNNKTFVGWSTNKNATGTGAYNYKSPVYAAGSTYTVTGNVTLYAIWAEKDLDAQFFIRLDGTIPTEPQGHSSSDYSSAINITGAIKIGEFYTDSTNGVASHLNSVPTDQQIKAAYSKYNPDTQYVLWYVIKHESTWHIDGVLLDKAKVNLAYNANAPAGVWSNMPDGAQYVVGTDATVSSKVPTRTDGYTFTGWNTAADGAGTSYSANDTITMNTSVTLYAQWINSNAVTITPGSASKTYDSTALTTSGLTATAIGLSDGDYLDNVVLSGTQTDAGSSAATVTSYTIRNSSGEDVTSYY